MTLYIRATKISGIPIENNSVMKAIQISLLGQEPSDAFSFCRITPDSNNKYQSAIESDKIWEFSIDPSSTPCSIVVRLLNMEPEEMEIQRTILSSSWFNIDSYVSEFFPLKPMVPSLAPAVALIDVHFVSSIPTNQIFTPFGCPKGEMAIYPRWRSIKPFFPSNQQQSQNLSTSNTNNNNDNNDDNQNSIQIQSLDDNNLQPLVPEENKSNSQESRFTITNLIRRTRSNSGAKNDKDIIDFPEMNRHVTRKIDNYYLAFEKYSFNEKTLQQKYEEFENGIMKANSQRRGSQNQIEARDKRRGSNNQIDNHGQRRESHNQISRPIPAIHNRKQNTENYKIFE